MKDQYGRDIDYLRLSLTERCTLKCAYCRAGEGKCPKKSELSADNFRRIAAAMVSLGVRKIRLTGGEPMLRRDLTEIIEACRSFKEIDEITMTTNAQQLPGRAAELRQAGLTRLNVSLDSLKANRYAELTGGGSLSAVLEGIGEALRAGLTPLKINVVLMRGKNDDEIDDFIDLARREPLDVRFIELMPLSASGDISLRVSSDEILSRRPWLKALPPRYNSQPSADYAGKDFRGRVGFISPISHRFCALCNRVRIMSDGTLRSCLGRDSEISLKPALAAGALELHRVIEDAIFHKPREHAFDEHFSSRKDMSRIGG